MQLTRNFYLSEFTNSQTARRLGLSNNPSPEHVENITALCVNVLEPIRSAWGRPVVISSGYRSPQVNAAVGGSRTSQHCNGQAADIEIFGIDNCDLCRWIDENLDYDQLILEFHNHSEGPNSGWVHVSYNFRGNRKSRLTATLENGKARYIPGFPWMW